MWEAGTSKHLVLLPNKWQKWLICYINSNWLTDKSTACFNMDLAGLICSAASFLIVTSALWELHLGMEVARSLIPHRSLSHSLHRAADSFTVSHCYKPISFPVGVGEFSLYITDDDFLILRSAHALAHWQNPYQANVFWRVNANLSFKRNQARFLSENS